MRRGASISARDARRLAVAAQGLARPLRNGRVTPATLRRAITSLAVLQLDAINVLERTQFVVPFARVGDYDRQLIHALTGPDGAFYETWAHAASLVPMEHEPLLRWRQAEMLAYGDSPTYAPRRRAFHEEHRTYIDALVDEIRDRGPLAASQLADPRRGTGDWWDRRGLGRQALEFLFARGELAAWRAPNFERVYDLPERVIPDAVRALPTPTVEEAHRALVLLAARAYGVATVADLAGYHMLKPRAVALRVAELVEDGALLQVAVDGWAEPAYAPPDARVVAPTRARATLLSPFDSLIWDRGRVLRLFGFDYRIEVYVPAPQRVYGYYVLPVLVGEYLVGRLDLKADRKASTLRVVAAHGEPDTDVAATAAAVAPELHAMRTWLGLDELAVARRGGLARALSGAVSPQRRVARSTNAT